MTPRLGWPVIGAAWLALELVTLRRQQTHGINDTASECTRDLWHTRTCAGRLIFRAVLYAGAVIFDKHITKGTS